MLIIRNAQLVRFPSGLEPNFEKTALAFVREQFPEVGEVTDDTLLLMIRDGAAAADDYGIKTVENVLRFLGFMLLLGLQFYSDPKSPWAETVLLREDLDETAKMTLLYDIGSSLEEQLTLASEVES